MGLWKCPVDKSIYEFNLVGTMRNCFNNYRQSHIWINDSALGNWAIFSSIWQEYAWPPQSGSHRPSVFAIFFARILTAVICLRNGKRLEDFHTSLHREMRVEFPNLKSKISSSCLSVLEFSLLVETICTPKYSSESLRWNSVTLEGDLREIYKVGSDNCRLLLVDLKIQA